jgi:uncharacterized protein YlxW (UPF0749 family)
MNRKALALSLTGVSALIGFMMTVQIASRPTTESTAGSYIDYRTQIAEQVQEHAILEQDISKTKAQIAEYHAASGSTDSLQQALAHDAAGVSQAAGTSPLSGPGLLITIRDNPLLPTSSQYADTFGTESDQFISLVVNYLFGNGAQAISINGQRLVTTSSIRLVQGAIGVGGLHINTHVIAQPYVITAIGDTVNMQAALTVNRIQATFNVIGEDFIVKSESGKNALTVPGYQGFLPGTWAKEVSGR